MRALLSIVLLISAVPVSHAQRAQTNMERANNAMDYCLEKSPDQVSKGRCHEALARDLAKKVKRALEDRADDVDQRDPKISGGAMKIAEAKQARKDADQYWGMILAAECDKLAAAEFYGGSGQGVHRQRCEINWLAARLDVMQISPDKYP